MLMAGEAQIFGRNAKERRGGDIEAAVLEAWEEVRSMALKQQYDLGYCLPEGGTGLAYVGVRSAGVPRPIASSRPEVLT